MILETTFIQFLNLYHILCCYRSSYNIMFERSSLTERVYMLPGALEYDLVKFTHKIYLKLNDLR